MTNFAFLDFCQTVVSDMKLNLEFCYILCLLKSNVIHVSYIYRLDLAALLIKIMINVKVNDLLCFLSKVRHSLKKMHRRYVFFSLLFT